MVVVLALRRFGRWLYASLFEFCFATYLFSWDYALFILNVVTPRIAEGKVVPRDHPGEAGQWPEYIPPQEGHSRCSCPALNALANHGILPRDGRNIPFAELTRTVRASYNFAPTFCIFVPRYIAKILNRSYSRGTFDLADIDVHNGIEHDASLVREDTFHRFHQGLPAAKLITELLTTATGPPPKETKMPVVYPEGPTPEPFKPLTEEINLDTTLTKADLSRALSRRRHEAKRDNPQFSLSHTHKLFGASNASTLLTIFGGRTRDLATFLIEERLPTGWESRVRDRWGLTFGKFNTTVIPVEYGIREEVERPLNLY